MSSESEQRLSMDELKDRNRTPISAPPQTPPQPTQATVECPNAKKCFERMERILAEQRRTSELLSALPTRKELAAMQASLERTLEAMQPPAKKPAGRKSAKRSSINWRRVRHWLWDHLPKPSWEWLIMIPLGGSAWLAWLLLNRIADSVSSIMRGLS